MHRFFAPAENLGPGDLRFSPDDARRIFRVRALPPGNAVFPWLQTVPCDLPATGDLAVFAGPEGGFVPRGEVPPPGPDYPKEPGPPVMPHRAGDAGAC